ncbi:MAG: hypothetical protein ACXWXS_09590 [Actinomycetota bacterium]
MGHGPSLEIEPEVAHGIVVRAFIGEAAGSLGIEPDQVADLQLAATELLASAVEAGSARFTLTFASGDEGWTLTASGVGDLRGSPAGLDFPRIGLLSGLFGEIEIDEATARLAGPRSDRP